MIFSLDKLNTLMIYTFCGAVIWTKKLKINKSHIRLPLYISIACENASELLDEQIPCFSRLRSFATSLRKFHDASFPPLHQSYVLILCQFKICKHSVHQNCEQYLNPCGLNPNNEVYWELLCTRAKSRDHKRVGTQKKVFKGRPETPPKSCIMVMDLKSIVTPCVTSPHPSANSMNFYSCGSSHMINKTNQQLWAFGMKWSPSFVIYLPPRGGFCK